MDSPRDARPAFELAVHRAPGASLRVVSLRGVVSNVASDGALSQLAAEVRGLGAQFERATAESSTEASTYSP